MILGMKPGMKTWLVPPILVPLLLAALVAGYAIYRTSL
jgi:hypothetical protein